MDKIEGIGIELNKANAVLGKVAECTDRRIEPGTAEAFWLVISLPGLRALIDVVCDYTQLAMRMTGEALEQLGELRAKIGGDGD